MGVSLAERTVVRVLGLSEVFSAHHNFYQDRPLISEKHSNIQKLVELFVDEVRECQQLEVDGTIEGFPVADYLQQELSDVFIFLICLHQEILGTTQSVNWIQKLEKKCKNTQKNIPLKLRSRAKQGEYDSLVWSAEHETCFQENFKDLVYIQNQIVFLTKNSLSTAALELKTKEKLLTLTEQAMQITWKIMTLCAQNPAEAVLEKIARNHVKYPAKGASKKNPTPKTQESYPTSPYPRARTDAYSQYRDDSRVMWSAAQGNRDFYGQERKSSPMMKLFRWNDEPVRNPDNSDFDHPIVLR